MLKNSPFSPRKQLYFLTVVHTVIDSYATVLPHLLPLLLKKLASQTAARNSLAGIIISVYSTFSSLGQIFFGWASDRFQTLHFVTFGVAFTAIALSLIGDCAFAFLGPRAARNWRLRCCSFSSESHQSSSSTRQRRERFCRYQYS